MTDDNRRPSWARTIFKVVLVIIFSLSIAAGLERLHIVSDITHNLTRDLLKAFIALGVIASLAVIMHKVIQHWFHAIPQLLKTLVSSLARRGALHWVFVTLLIVVGIHAGGWLHGIESWLAVRYQVYQWLQTLTPRQVYPRRTVLVLVGDEEYWKGELAGRVPIKRTYLAKLLRALDSANPLLIAFDFDLRSPTPEGDIREHPDYHEETQEFLETVKVVSHKRPIVLPRTVKFDNDQQCYRLDPAIFGGFDFEGGKVLEGYITLPYDLRQVPLTVKTKDMPPIDSFAGAIVRATDQRAIQYAKGIDCKTENALPYGGYVKAEDFSQFLGSYILNAEPSTLRAELNHKIVIVGAAWHSLMLGRGQQIDTHFTPVGWLGGPFIHANYTEAWLDSRIYEPWTEDKESVIKIIFSIAIAIVFALVKEYPWNPIVAILIIASVLLSFSYILFHNLGVFFDPFVLIILLTGHVVIEQICEWKSEAHKWRAHCMECPTAKET
jgi:CHASE2 domain-containing sensor protein